jgi:hypothetical protein
MAITIPGSLGPRNTASKEESIPDNLDLQNAISDQDRDSCRNREINRHSNHWQSWSHNGELWHRQSYQDTSNHQGKYVPRDTLIIWQQVITVVHTISSPQGCKTFFDFAANSMSSLHKMKTNACVCITTTWMVRHVRTGKEWPENWSHQGGDSGPRRPSPLRKFFCHNIRVQLREIR